VLPLELEAIASLVAVCAVESKLGVPLAQALVKSLSLGWSVGFGRPFASDKTTFIDGGCPRIIWAVPLAVDFCRLLRHGMYTEFVLVLCTSFNFFPLLLLLIRPVNDTAPTRAVLVFRKVSKSI
jgi:hypothetical protein